MSILSSTGTGFYNMPLNDKTLQWLGYNISSMYSGNLGSYSYLEHNIATHDEFKCYLEKYSDADNVWFTVFRQKMSTIPGIELPEFNNGIFFFKVYFETTGQLKEFEKYFRIKDNPSYTDEQKEQLLCYFFEHGYKFLII